MTDPASDEPESADEPLDPGTAALLDAVRRAPDDPDLRSLLCDRLLAAGRNEQALEQASIVLASAPDDVTALRVAATAVGHLGDLTRSLAYWRIHDALSSAEEPRSDTASSPGLLPNPPQVESSPSIPEPVPTGEASSAGSSEGTWPGLEEDPGISLADVAGMDDVKRRLHSMFLTPLENPQLREMYATDLRGGLMLYGPPGCGKTYIARALAGELGTRFIHIGIPDILDMWIGNSEANVHAVFEHARSQSPVVLFLDEVDVLGASRAALRSNAMSGVVAQLLVEMDGLAGGNDGIFVLAATNQPWSVDTALRRPGRFDRMLFVAPPDATARAAILSHHLANRPTAADIDCAAIAHHTAGFSGADLAAIATDAAQEALADSVASGTPRPICQADLQRALQQRSPTTEPWLDIARNVVSFSDSNGEFSDLADYLGHKPRRRR